MSDLADVKRRIRAFDDAVDARWDALRGNPIADRVFYGASALGDHSLLWLLLGAARGLRSAEGWPHATRLAIAMGVESALVNGGIKSLFRRARPVLEQQRPFRLRRPRTSSFPSGHATSSFTAAALLSEDDPLWPLYYGLALTVSLSRVHVKIHHASDVLAGIGVGVVLGAVARRVLPMPSATPGHPDP